MIRTGIFLSTDDQIRLKCLNGYEQERYLIHTVKQTFHNVGFKVDDRARYSYEKGDGEILLVEKRND